jgi:hypothetical protein
MPFNYDPSQKGQIAPSTRQLDSHSPDDASRELAARYNEVSFREKLGLLQARLAQNPTFVAVHNALAVLFGAAAHLPYPEK